MMVSLSFLGRTREPAHELNQEKVAQGMGWAQLMRILRVDANFRWFLLARLLALNHEPAAQLRCRSCVLA